MHQQRPGGSLGGKEGVQGDPNTLPALDSETRRLIQDQAPVIFKKYLNMLQLIFPNIPIIIVP
jgi:hypothetical protein